MQHVFYQWGHPRMREWGLAPNSSFNVTCIFRQYFILGWLDSSLWAGGQYGKWEGELSSSCGSCRSFTLWVGTSTWPSIWRLAPDVLSTRSLNLAAIHMKLMAVNWNSRYGHSLWAQRSLARNHINHLIWGNHFLFTLFRTPCVCHQWGFLSDMGVPPTWEKGSHLPPRTTKLGKLRDRCNSATAPTAKPDLGFSSW